MGTKLPPSHANLFMTKFEEKYVYTYPPQPTLWKRFIDDICPIWSNGTEPLQEFINHLNKVHPTIKFTSVISSSQIPLLTYCYTSGIVNYTLDFIPRQLTDTCI